MRYKLTFLILLINGFYFQAQDVWRKDFKQFRGFIENQGQYDHIPTDSRVLFGSAVDGKLFYFTPSGFHYVAIESIPMDEELFEKQEEKKRNQGRGQNGHRRPEPAALEEFERMMQGKKVSHLYSMRWEGANPNTSIESEGEQEGYHTFQNSSVQAKSFKRLIYRNLYPNIDVVFEFLPQQNGLKYSYILHPGADYRLIALRYDNEQKLNINKRGELEISNPFAAWRESIPGTTDGVQQYDVFYSKNGNTISFRSDKNLLRQNKSREIILDPWLQTFSNAPAYQMFEIGKDKNDQVWVFGKTDQVLMSCFTATGTLLWQYHPNLLLADFFGDMAVHPDGYAYIVWWGSIWRIDNTGASVWNKYWDDAVTNPSVINENWRCAFNCDYSKLIIAKDWGTSEIYTVRTDNNQIGPYIKTFPANDGEIRALNRGLTGSIYGLTISVPPQIISVNPDLTPGFTLNSNQDFQYVQGYNGWGGKNCIAGGSQFIYTFDGISVVKRDVLNGAELMKKDYANAVGPEMNAGVDVDECGNVYVGLQDRVVKLDQNMQELSFQLTNQPVYDLVLGPGGGVFICGNEFIALQDFGHCGPVTCPCVSSSYTNASCVDGTGGTATIEPIGGVGPFTYLWDDGQVTQTAINLSIGKHTYTVTNSQGCTVKGEVIVETLSAEILVVQDPTINTTTCVLSNDGIIYAETNPGSGPYTYEWNGVPGSNNDTLFGCKGGLNQVIITDALGCKDTVNYRVEVANAFTVDVVVDNYCGITYVSLYTMSPSPAYYWNGVLGMQYYEVTQPELLNYELIDLSGACIIDGKGSVQVTPVASYTPFNLVGISYLTYCDGTSSDLIVNNNNPSGNNLNLELYDELGYLLNSYDSNEDFTISNVNIPNGSFYLYDDAGCNYIYEYLPAANTGALNLIYDTICVGDTKDLNYSGTHPFTWVNESETVNIAANVMTVKPVVADTFWIRLNLSCPDSIGYVIEILDLDQLALPDTIYLCGDNGTDLNINEPGLLVTWEKNGQLFNNPVINATDGKYYLYASKGQCSLYDSVVVVTGSQAAISGTGLICLGDSMIIQYAGSGSINWVPAAWQTQVAADAVKVSPPGNATVMAVYTDAACYDTLTFDVNVNPLPTGQVIGDTLDCLNPSVNLMAVSPGSTIAWSNNGTPVNGNPILVSNPGNYTVTFTDLFGCQSQQTITVDQQPGPDAGFTASPLSGYQPLAVEFTNTSQYATTYQWDFGNGQSSVEVDPSMIYQDSGFYTVTLYAINDLGCKDSFKIVIHVMQAIACGSSHLFIPNVLTVNGDHVNDNFKVTHDITVPFTFSCVILNRWGEVITTLTDINQSWDGKTSQGKLCSDGVYYYLIHVGCAGSEEEIQGYIHLVK